MTNTGSTFFHFEVKLPNATAKWQVVGYFLISFFYSVQVVPHSIEVMVLSSGSNTVCEACKFHMASSANQAGCQPCVIGSLITLWNGRAS